MSDSEVRLGGELTVIRPGDTVLVRVPQDTKPKDAERLLERMRERLPDVEWCVLSGVDGVHVYRPQGDALC